MDIENDRVKAARALLSAIERGDGAALVEIYDDEVVQIEHPNRLKQKGDRRGREAMLRDLDRGKQLLREQRYEVISAVSDGDRVALQVQWTGVLAVPVATLGAGDAMRCQSAIFLRFQGDRVVEQSNYDCLEPF